jgi:hypothetical protein
VASAIKLGERSSRHASARRDLIAKMLLDTVKNEAARTIDR